MNPILNRLSYIASAANAGRHLREQMPGSVRAAWLVCGDVLHLQQVLQQQPLPTQLPLYEPPLPIPLLRRPKQLHTQWTAAYPSSIPNSIALMPGVDVMGPKHLHLHPLSISDAGRLSCNLPLPSTPLLPPCLPPSLPPLLGMCACVCVCVCVCV